MKSVIAAFLFLSLCLVPLTSAFTSVLVAPSTMVLTVGGTFTISLIISPDQEVDTVAIDLLTWNSNILECIDVEQGNLFINPLIWMPGNIHNDEGKLELMVIASSIPTELPNILCNITFKAKNSGVSAITIEVFGVARNGTDIPKQILNYCQVTVTEQQQSSVNPPPSNPPINLPPEEDTSCNCSNETENETQNTSQKMSINNITNETIPPATSDNSTNTTNQNIETNSDIGIPDTISPTIIFYIAVIIIAISVISIIIIHHFKEKEEEEEDEFDVEEFLKKKDENGKTDSGSQLQK